jgi:general stress protein YciG
MAQGKPRGFAAMDPKEVKRIASLGGKASHGGGRPKGSTDVKPKDA